MVFYAYIIDVYFSIFSNIKLCFIQGNFLVLGKIRGLGSSTLKQSLQRIYSSVALGVISTNRSKIKCPYHRQKCYSKITPLHTPLLLYWCDTLQSIVHLLVKHYSYRIQIQNTAEHERQTQRKLGDQKLNKNLSGSFSLSGRQQVTRCRTNRYS